MAQADVRVERRVGGGSDAARNARVRCVLRECLGPASAPALAEDGGPVVQSRVFTLGPSHCADDARQRTARAGGAGVEPAVGTGGGRSRPLAHGAHSARREGCVRVDGREVVGRPAEGQPKIQSRLRHHVTLTSGEVSFHFRSDTTIHLWLFFEVW